MSPQNPEGYFLILCRFPFKDECPDLNLAIITSSLLLESHYFSILHSFGFYTDAYPFSLSIPTCAGTHKNETTLS